jgi:hypothetical protein
MNHRIRIFIFFALILALTFSALGVTPAQAVGTQVTLTSGTSWTVPAGVTNISIECWGAGGGGGNRTFLNGQGGGGGGGTYAKVLSTQSPPVLLFQLVLELVEGAQ